MPVVLIASPATSVTDALVTRLRAVGWDVASDDGEPVDAVVVDAGLSGAADGADAAAADRASYDVVTGLVEGVGRWRFRSPEDGGGAIVVVGSRDQLGSARRVAASALAGALASAVRSLALQLAPAQVRVNLVAPADPSAEDVRGLLPAPVTAEDVAATVAFFTDPRSTYITGQVLYVCAGASLLSSSSV